jgi:ferric-dicitrate binding protein FerR (iron transport regulator)
MILRLLRRMPALLIAFAATSLGEASADPASTQTEPMVIGDVVGLTPAVHGSITGLLSIGSPVHLSETIKTGPSGVIELQFLDNTHLMLGSNSSVVLDSFVYEGGGKAKSVILQFARGAFRFATGDSAKKAYQIRAPQASIGVRGTKFQVDSRSPTSAITLYEGKTYICPPRRPSSYCKIVKPGETALVGDDRIIRIVSAAGSPTEHCIGSPNSKICDIFGGQ